MAITGVGNYSSVYENTYALSRTESRRGKRIDKTALTEAAIGKGCLIWIFTHKPHRNTPGPAIHWGCRMMWFMRNVIKSLSK